MADRDDIGAAMAQRLQEQDDEAILRWLLDGPASPVDRPITADRPPMEPAREPVLNPMSGAAATATAIAQTPRAVGRGVVLAGTNAARTLASAIDPMINALHRAGGHEDQAPDQMAAGLEPILETIEQFIPPPETAIGRGEQAISQFLTGFVISRRLLGGWQPASAAGEVLKSAIAGGVAEGAFMEAHAGNLANLIQAVPELANPVTEFLATDPADGEAVNRLRNAVAGTVSGLAVDGAVASFKVLRALGKRMLGRAPGAPQPLAQRAQQIAANAQRLESEAVDTSWAALGYDPLAPKIKLTRVSQPEAVIRQKLPSLTREAAQGDDLVRADRLAAAGEPPAEGSRIFINFARIDGPEDIQGAIDELTRGREGAIEAARRGVRTWEQTQAAAGRVDAFNALMEQRAQRGLAIPTAERQLAMRQLWSASGDQLVDLAEAVVKNPTDANRFLLKKATAAHYTIQEEVIAARTETARALNAWKIAADTPARRLQQMQAAVEASGGAGTADELAKILASFRGNEDQLAGVLDDVVRGSLTARTGQALQHIWINGLLSGPQTHVANTVSNATVTGIRMLETKIAAGISQALDTPGGVAPGEALALWRGYVEASKDLFKLGADETGAFWRYLAGDEQAKALVPMASKMERQGLGSPLAPEVWGVAKDTTLGYAARGVAAFVGLPGKALQAQDYIFKILHARATLHAAAVREAATYAAQHNLDDAAIKARIAASLANPSEAMLAAADDAALLNTFNNPTGALGNSMMALRGAVPAGPVLLPFVRNPVNLFRYAAERSPLAPMVGQWRADIAAGGARRDMALARLAMGTTAFLAAFDMAQSGLITGRAPQDPGEAQHWARTGRQAYSMRLPGSDRWYGFSRIDPMGFTLGAAGDLAQIMGPDFREDLHEDASKAVSGAIMAAAWNMTSKTYMSGVSSLMQAAVYGSGTAAENYFERLVGSLVPTGVAKVAEAVDPVMVEVNGAVDALVARTPWASKDLPAQVDLWGRERTRASGLGAAWDVLMPIRSSDPKAEPIDRELERLRYYPERAGRDVRFAVPGLPDVVLDLEAFDPRLFNAYQRAAGAAALAPLNAVVSGVGPLGSRYHHLRDEARVDLIGDYIRDARRAAAAQLLQASPELRAEVVLRGQLQKTAQGLVR